MSTITKLNDIGGVSTLTIGSSVLPRLTPEPRSSFSNVLGGVVNAAKGVLGGAAGSLVGIDPEYRQLIEAQLAAQDQMQRVSLTSNILKSKHETDMAAVRNVRVG